MSPKDNNKQVSAAVRILQQKRDASARATHLMVKNDSLITYEKAFLGQAAIKKFFIATFLERKIMSTKTSFKRIALVAASALAIAGFSAVPANADAGDATSIVVSKSTTDDGTALAVGKYTASKVLNADGISSFTIGAGSVVALNVVAVGGDITDADTVTVTMRGIGVVSFNEVDTAAAAAGDTAVLDTFTATSIPGTYTLDISILRGDTPTALNATVTTSVTMVVSALSSFSAGRSTAYIVGGNTGTDTATATTDAVAVTASKSLALGNAAGIIVKLNDIDGAAMATAKGNLLSATVTGPGWVRWDSTTTDDLPAADQCSLTPTYSNLKGRSVTAQGTDGDGTLYVCADGAAGVSTVSISITDAAGTTVSLATKTVTFYGTAKDIAVHATNYSIGKAGGGTTGSTTATAETDTPAFVIKTSDGTSAAGTTVPTVTSSNLAVVASSDCALDGNDPDYGYGAVGYFDCRFITASTAKSGDTATLTIKTPNLAADATGLTDMTTTFVVTVGGAVATEVLSVDKSSYLGGEAMVVTLTAKDASGNPVFDGAASPAVTANKPLGGTAIGAGTYVGGISATSATKPTVFAPSVSGEFTLRATSSATGSPVITATSSVEGDPSAALALDAANAATDAANNAYDEAQNATQAASDALAAVTALAAQVKSLIASVKKLTAAVAKLKK